MSIFGQFYLFSFTKIVNPIEFERKYFGKMKFLAANCCNITNFLDLNQTIIICNLIFLHIHYVNE